jgi:hypothetical protein
LDLCIFPASLEPVPGLAVANDSSSSRKDRYVGIARFLDMYSLPQLLRVLAVIVAAIFFQVNDNASSELLDLDTVKRRLLCLNLLQ